MRRALILVDLQHGFVNGHSRGAVPAALALAREGAFDAVFATRFVNPGAEGPWVRRMGWTRFAPGSAEADLLPEVAAAAGRVFDKQAYGPPKELMEALAGMAPVEPHLCGIDTDGCVLAIALALWDAGMAPVVHADACASHGGPAGHAAALGILRRLVGRDGVLGG